MPLLIILAAGCGNEDDRTAAPVVVSPLVMSTYPHDGQDSVAVDVEIRAEFTAPIDCSSLDSSSIILDGGAVAGDIECDGRYVNFRPLAYLETYRRYSVAVAGSIRDASGLEMGKDVEWTFTTGGIWSKVDSGTDKDLVAVARSDETFVAVGKSGTILTSESGVDWEKSSVDRQIDLHDAIWTGSEFVAVGSRSEGLTETALFSRSPDGISWSVEGVSAARGGLYSAVYDDSKYVAVGYGSQILSSPDGISWTLESDTVRARTLCGIEFADSQYIAVGYAYDTDLGGHGFPSPVIATTDSNLVWTQERLPMLANLLDVVWTGVRFVVVGYSSSFPYESRILSPDENGNWVNRLSGASGQLRSIEKIGGIFVTVGDDGALMTSKDGLSWSVGPALTAEDLYDISESADRVVIVGESGIVLSTPRLAFRQQYVGDIEE